MRWVAGILLVGAAVLKAYKLLTDPVPTLVNSSGRYFLPVENGVELGIGLLLLTGLYWQKLRWFALSLFTSFAGYSFYLACTGAASCGCFGPVHINPWWTFGLDSVVVLGLLTSAFLGRYSQENMVDSSETALKSTARTRHYAIALVVGITVIGTSLLVRYADKRTALADGLSMSVGGLVILEPERWIGQKLPITDSVDLDLSKGSWIVLLYRHDCLLCEEKLRQYEQRAAAGERIALVEVPPFGEFGHREKAGYYGRLIEDHQWFVQTPLEIRLRDSVVMTVKSHVH